VTRYTRHRHAHRVKVEETTRCPNPVYLEYIAPGGDPALGVLATPCKRWACDHCGKGKRAEALKLARHVADTGRDWDPRQPLRFVTLTRPMATPADIHDSDDWKRASADLSELVKAGRRRWSRPGATHKLEYLRVTESTKRGRIHLHLITWGHWVPKCTDKGRRARGLPTGKGSGSPCYCCHHHRPPALTRSGGCAVCETPRPCIQRLAHRHGWGWVEVRRIRSPKQAAVYVAKYLGKQAAEDWPRHVRRLSYSRHAAGGATLGKIHAAWVAEVHRRMADPSHNDAGRVIDRTFIGIVPRPSLYQPRPPPTRPLRWFSHATGEQTPAPF